MRFSWRIRQTTRIEQNDPLTSNSSKNDVSEHRYTRTATASTERSIIRDDQLCAEFHVVEVVLAIQLKCSKGGTLVYTVWCQEEQVNNVRVNPLWGGPGNIHGFFLLTRIGYCSNTNGVHRFQRELESKFGYFSTYKPQ